MDKKDNSISISLKTYLLVIIVYIFFSTVNFSLNFVLLFFLLLLSFLITKNLKINNKDAFTFLFLAFLTSCFISLFSIYDNNVVNGLIFILCALIFLFVYVCLTHLKKDWLHPFIKYISAFLLLFALGTLTQVFFPNIIENIKSVYIQSNKVGISQNFVTTKSIYGGYNGLVVQISVNAFLMCLYIGICLYNLFTHKNNKRYILMIVLGFILLLLTNKRTLIFAGAFSFIFTFLMYKRWNLKYILATLIFSFTFIFIIFNYTNIGNRFISKMNMSKEDMLSGRDVLYEKMIDNFIKSPIIGVGIDSKVYDKDGHNIYLQVASETGIIGFIFLMSFLIKNYIVTAKYLLGESDYREFFALSFYIQTIFLIWGMTGNTLYDQFVLLTYFVSIAITTYSIKCINSNCDNKGAEK